MLYASQLVDVTRHPEQALPKQMARLVEYGASPRATIAFCKAARAQAVLSGRAHVLPEDIAKLAHRVLRHRLILGFEAASARHHRRGRDRRGDAGRQGPLRCQTATVGKHLNRAKAHFGTDTRGLLEGGRYALLHTRSMEFDDLRPYVPGDDVRDIDWKASARSGGVLIKRFVSEKHHKILLVADAGRNMSALAPSGELQARRRRAHHGCGGVDRPATIRSDRHGLR